MLQLNFFKCHVGIIRYLDCILCSPDNIKDFEKTQFQYSQYYYLHEMLNEIYPRYVLITRLLDPFNSNKCYIFVENAISKEIKHYTAILNDKVSLEFVKNKILNKYNAINENFNICFSYKAKIHEDILIFQNKLYPSKFYKFRKFLKQMIDKSSFLIFKIDKTKVLKYNIKLKSSDFYKCTSSYICHYLKEIILLGDKIRKIINLEIYSIDDSTCMKQLEQFLTRKIMRSYIFDSHNVELQLKEINNLAKIMYYYCIRHDIQPIYVKNYILEKINQISNKMAKFTFYLCFVKIISYESDFHNRPKILKLVIFLLVYYKHSFIELNSVESLFMIYNISRNIEKKNKKIYNYKDMCISDDINSFDLKKVIILRYIFLVLVHKNVFLQKIICLLENPEFLENIWLIVKCCLLTLYDIFDITF